MAIEFYHLESKNDESIENAKFTKSMKVLNLIIDEYYYSYFTIEDLKMATQGNFQKKSFQKLVDDGFLFFDEKLNKYSIDHSSSKIARIIMQAESVKEDSEHQRLYGDLLMQDELYDEDGFTPMIF